jgi:hypothetical protein
MASGRFDGRPVLTLEELEAHDPRSRAGGRERRFLCPLAACTDHQRSDHHRSLALNVESGLWTCHRCGASGRLRERWASGSRLGRDRRIARRAFATAASRSAPGSAPSVGAARDRYAAASPLLGTRGADYLATRGIAPKLADAARVRFAVDFYGRPAVLFPLHDRSDLLVAVNGRYVDGRSDPKARTAGRKARGVFATRGAFDAEQLAICEAPIDALSLSMCGIPAIALCGTSAPEWLAAACAFRRVGLAFDADEAGERAVARLVGNLTLGSRCARLCPPVGKDWNDSLRDLGRITLTEWLQRDGVGAPRRDQASPKPARNRPMAARCLIKGCPLRIAPGDLVYCSAHRQQADSGTLWGAPTVTEAPHRRQLDTAARIDGLGAPSDGWVDVEVQREAR